MLIRDVFQIWVNCELYLNSTCLMFTEWVNLLPRLGQLAHPNLMLLQPVINVTVVLLLPHNYIFWPTCQLFHTVYLPADILGDVIDQIYNHDHIWSIMPVRSPSIAATFQLSLWNVSWNGCLLGKNHCVFSSSGFCWHTIRVLFIMINDGTGSLNGMTIFVFIFLWMSNKGYVLFTYSLCMRKSKIFSLILEYWISLPANFWALALCIEELCYHYVHLIIFMVLIPYELFYYEMY